MAIFGSRLWGATLLFVASAATASITAQPRSCKEIIAGITVLKLGADARVEDSDPACVVTNAEAIMSPTQSLHIDRLSIASSDLRQAAAHGIPHDLAIDATGIRFAPKLTNTHARYLMEIRQNGFNAHLHYVWDVPNRRLRLDDVSLDGPSLGHVSLAMDADVQNIDARVTPPRPEGLAIRRIDMVLDNRGVVEGMILPFVIGLIPADVDPAVEIPRVLAGQETSLRALPASAADTASKDALIRFTRDFPHPSGHFAMSLVFDKAMGVKDLAKLSTPADPGWKHFRIEASYIPTPDPAVPSVR